MNITICYENHKTTLDVPEEDFALMIRLDYEKRLTEAKDPSVVTPRTPQVIMEERFNKPDFNNWRKFKGGCRTSPGKQSLSMHFRGSG